MSTVNGRGLFKGSYQCSCARCDRPKGDRDSNAGWLEVQERGRASRVRVLCPTCAPALLVALDQSLQCAAVTHLRVISTQLLADAAKDLRDEGKKYRAQLLENLIGEVQP